MKKLSIVGLFVLIILGLHGCGSSEEYNAQPYEIMSMTQIPKEFSVEVENYSTKNFEYWLESPSKEVLFLRKVKNGKGKANTEKIFCTEYSNEETLVAYECDVTFSDKKREKESESIVLEKGLRYMFRFSGNAPTEYTEGEGYSNYHAIKEDAIEVYIPRDKE
jgi:hypothetical protein